MLLIRAVYTSSSYFCLGLFSIIMIQFVSLVKQVYVQTVRDSRLKALQILCVLFMLLTEYFLICKVCAECS